MPPTNEAAWHSAKKVAPFKVGPAPYTPPGPGEVVIKNGAAAINPFDWVIQIMGQYFLPYLKYPNILGTDVAGSVVEVGPDVTRFRVGDRVCGSAVSISKQSNNPAEGGFQLYCVLREHLIAPTPDHITDEQACVLGLGLGTAAMGLFDKNHLGLDLPTVPARPNHTKGSNPRALIVTGGSSSVGSNAVQLAVAAGYKVLSTSSPKNFTYVKNLGASHVFDYKSNTLVEDMLNILDGYSLAGALAIGGGATEACVAIMRRHDPGSTNKFISLAGNTIPDASSFEGSFATTTRMLSTMGWFLKTAIMSYFTQVKVKFVNVGDLVEPKGVVARVYVDFLPQALATRQFVPAPDPLVAGKGVGKIQEAMELQMKGVSAKKVVVSF